MERHPDHGSSEEKGDGDGQYASHFFSEQQGITSRRPSVGLSASPYHPPLGLLVLTNALGLRQENTS